MSSSNQLRLVYFAWIRERIGLDEETVRLPDQVQTVGDLLRWLQGRDERYAHALENETFIRVAIDREHVDDRGQTLRTAREVALFPPMTGG